MAEKPIIENIEENDIKVDDSMEKESSPSATVKFRADDEIVEIIASQGSVDDPQEKEPSPTAVASSETDAKTDNDVSTHSKRKTSFLNSTSARKNWQKAVGKCQLLHVLEKVDVENKVGIKAEELGDDDVLKVISLALQRALRGYGNSKYSAHNLADSANLECKDLGDNSIEFEAVADKSTYSVPQPKFICTDWHAEHFQECRKAFKLNNTAYFSSVGLQARRKESNFYVISSKDASGKSVSFFLLSACQKVIFKLCTNSDMKCINKIIEKYTEYVKSCASEGGPNKTLLPQFFGVYSLQFDDPNIPNVVLMAQKNFFAASYKIHKKYDLKGSTHNRFACEKEKAKKSPCFKDLDWIHENHRLRIKSKDELKAIRDQLNKDTLFLSANNLIDYSLLIGIHNRKHNLAKSRIDTYVTTATKGDDGTVKYYGLVDILTKYKKKKKAETFFTSTLMCGRDVSCQPPPKYQARFIKFCDDHILATYD